MTFKLNHWLYTYIPRTRKEAIGRFQICTWALFGNEDFGIFGDTTVELPSAWITQRLRARGSSRPTFLDFLAFFRRHPFYNLRHHVFRPKP